MFKPTQPAQWAIDRAKEHMRNLPGYRGAMMFGAEDATIQANIHAVAHYIEAHEKAPPDADVINLRAILAEYIDTLPIAAGAQQMHEGRNDETPGFRNALIRFRATIGGMKRSRHDDPDVYIEAMYQAALQTLGKLTAVYIDRAPLPPASTVQVALQQIEILVSQIIAPKQPISHEQMTLWTRRLLSARWMAQGEVARARSVENGTQDHNVAFVAVRAVLAEILAGQNFG